MTALRLALLIAHFIGLAAILGPMLDQLRAPVKRVTTAMVWGARAQILTGLALVGVAFGSEVEFDHVKVAVKFVVALAIAGLAESAYKRSSEKSPVWVAIGVLTVINIIVAVVWR